MSKSKNPAPPAAPETPKPQSEYFYDDGNLRSQRVWDGGRNAYTTKTFSTPDEKNIQDKATGFISGLVDKVPTAFNMSPEQISGYREAYADPQRRALNDSYNQAQGQANLAGSASGMRNSVGFAKYQADQLEKNRAQGLADIESNAKLMEFELPRMALAPYGDAFNLVNAALSGEQARSMSSLEPSFQGSQATSNFLLNAANSNYANQLNQYQLNNQRRGGFFSTLFGGF